MQTRLGTGCWKAPREISGLEFKAFIVRGRLTEHSMEPSSLFSVTICNSSFPVYLVSLFVILACVSSHGQKIM